MTKENIKNEIAAKKEKIQNEIAALEVVKNQNLTNLAAVMLIVGKIIELQNELKLIELSALEEVNGNLELDGGEQLSN